MTSVHSDEQTPIRSLNENYGSLGTTSNLRATRILETPVLDNVEAEDRVREDLPPEWDDSENTENPLNWSRRRKYSIIALVSFIELLTQLSSMLYAPGLPVMQRDFHSHNDTLATFSMSIYVLGFGIGPLLFAPLSEVYGRRIIYQCCLVMFLCFTVACATSSTINMLVGFRFGAGCFGAAPVAIGGAMVYDLFSVEERGAAMAIYNSGPILGNLLGPPLGGLIIQYTTWRWVFWIISILAGWALLCSFLILRETHTPTILRKLNLSEVLNSEAITNDSILEKSKPVGKLFRAIQRPLGLLLCSPVVFACSLIIAVIGGCMNLIFTSLARTFQDEYGFSTSSSGLMYLGITTGFAIAALVFGRTSDRVSQSLTKRNKGKREAEFRLPATIIGLPLVVIGLAWYGWAAQNHLFWLVPVLGLNAMGIGVTTTHLSVQTYLIDGFTDFSASALAGTTLARSLGGSLIPLTGPVLHSEFGLGWGNSLLAVLNLALCTIPCGLFIWGKTWRERYGFENRTIRGTDR